MFLKKEYTEEEMIAGCVANDRRAQEYLYRQYFQQLWSMTMKYLKSETDATSIVNEGLLKVFLKIDKYENKGNLESWLKRIVYNTMVDHIRKNQKHTRFIELDDHESSASTSSSHGLAEEDIMQEVNKLPTMLKEVFELYAIQGYNHSEISLRLNINEGTSRWYLSEARKKLREKIDNFSDFKSDVR